jgi:hypothetical protein
MRKLMAIATAGMIALSGSNAIAASMTALTSMETQVTKQANESFPIKMTGEATGAFKIEGSKLTILRDGFFNISAAAQVGGSGTGDVYMWMRVNGKDVPDSNSQQTIPTPKFTAVLVAQTGMELKKNDVVEFVISATAPGLGIVAFKPANMPAVPSIIFSIFEL